MDNTFFENISILLYMFKMINYVIMVDILIIDTVVIINVKMCNGLLMGWWIDDVLINLLIMKMGIYEVLLMLKYHCLWNFRMIILFLISSHSYLGLWFYQYHCRLSI